MAGFTAAYIAVGCLVLYLVGTHIDQYIKRRSFSKAHGCKPIKVYPQWDHLMGSDWMKSQLKAYSQSNFLGAAWERFQAEGPTFQGTTMGRIFIQTIDPENVKAILNTNFKDFGLGPRMGQMGAFLGSGIFTTDGAAWEHSRALVRPNFNKMQVRELSNLEKHVQQVIDHIPKDGKTVDLQELFFGLTLDSATELLFGESVNALEAHEHEESAQYKFVQAYDYCQAQVLLQPKDALMRAIWRNRKFEKACATVHEFVDKYVDSALRSISKSDKEKDGGRYVFLEEIAKETTDRKALRDEVLNVLLAGRDTTASLLSNTFHVLARNPRVWTALCEEVDQLGGVAPTYETLRNMKYTKYLLNESLRLYPVVPMNQRFAVRDTTLPHGGGPDGQSPIIIPKGQSVSYHVFSMHRRKDIYGPDAEEFRPERWETLRPGWGYLPFNGGPRICPGQQFALTEASYTIVRLVQEFSKIESRDDQPWKELLGMTTASQHGTKVALTPRH